MRIAVSRAQESAHLYPGPCPALVPCCQQRADWLPRAALRGRTSARCARWMYKSPPQATKNTQKHAHQTLAAGLGNGGDGVSGRWPELSAQAATFVPGGAARACAAGWRANLLDRGCIAWQCSLALACLPTRLTLSLTGCTLRVCTWMSTARTRRRKLCKPGPGDEPGGSRCGAPCVQPAAHQEGAAQCGARAAHLQPR